MSAISDLYAQCYAAVGAAYPFMDLDRRADVAAKLIKIGACRRSADGAMVFTAEAPPRLAPAPVVGPYATDREKIAAAAAYAARAAHDLPPEPATPAASAKPTPRTIANGATPAEIVESLHETQQAVRAKLRGSR